VIRRTADAGEEPAAEAPRRPGRPRRSSIDDTIVAATLELLQRGGADAITIDGIAARSGSAKTTIYRRWPSLEGLIIDALRVAMRDRMDPADEVREFDGLQGSPIHGAARQILGLIGSPVFQASFPMMARILLGDPVLGERFRTEVFGPLRSIRRDELREMAADGRMRAGIDPDLILDMVNGAVLYRALLGGRLDEDVADEIADLVSGVLAPRPPIASER
jgi:AcrR family transcriptional regulator